MSLPDPSERRGERGWKAEAKQHAFAALQAQTDQMGLHLSAVNLTILTEATLGAAFPYLELACRDAVFAFMSRALSPAQASHYHAGHVLDAYGECETCGKKP